MATSRRFFDGAQEELGSLPIEATSQPQPPTPVLGKRSTFLWIKDGATWRLTIPNMRISGAYKFVQPYIKISNEWK